MKYQNLKTSETQKVAFSCKTSQCWQSVCMKHYQSGCLKTFLAATTGACKLTTDKNNYKGFEARSWVKNMKGIFFILCYCLTTYSLSWNALAQGGNFHSLPPLSGENSFLLQCSEKKTPSDKLFIYLTNLPLIYLNHQNGTTPIWIKG